MRSAGWQRVADAVAREVDGGRIPGVVMRVQHRGEGVLSQALGLRDPQQGAPLHDDAIFRIYSMTKPIVSVGLMMLVEEGRLRLHDPVARHLGEFANVELGTIERDADGREAIRRRPLAAAAGEPAARPTVHDLLLHTAGLTYGRFGASKIKSAYIAAGVESGRLDNQAFSRRLATLPLAYEPGTRWEYSRATDLLGTLIERISGQTLGDFLRERIFEPLQMRDTGFSVPQPQQHRIAEAFAVDPPSGQAIRLLDPRRPPVFESGGGGLLSTADDYLRFAQLLLAGGALDGVRLLGRKTVALMTADHLGADLIRASRVPAATTGYLPGAGYGFGLGFAVRIAAGESGVPGSVGDFHWSGMAGTCFWVDPQEQLIAIWLMQAPSQLDDCRALYRNLVYAAL